LDLITEKFLGSARDQEVIRIEPENFLTFLRVSGSERSPYTNFPMESGPMRLFSRRCLASESGLCLSWLDLIPG
jgi:hypothetical protein